MCLSISIKNCGLFRPNILVYIFLSSLVVETVRGFVMIGGEDAAHCLGHQHGVRMSVNSNGHTDAQRKS